MLTKVYQETQRGMDYSAAMAVEGRAANDNLSVAEQPVGAHYRNPRGVGYSDWPERDARPEVAEQSAWGREPAPGVDLYDEWPPVRAQARKGDWLQTFSGRIFFPMDPRAEEVFIEDIAHSLSMQCRYAGHCLRFYCPTPDQRILTDDLRWVPAGDLKVGDGLFAFDEEPVRAGSFGKNRRRMKRARVTTALPVKRRTIRLVMADGSDVVSSSEHPWLIATKASGNQKWMSAEKIASDLTLGRKRHIHKYFTPWETHSTRDAGWLAGIYDGEGYLSTKNRRGTQLGVAQKPGIVLSKIETLLRNFGHANYRYCQTGSRESGVITLQSQGGFSAIASLLGSIRPDRLLHKFTESLKSGEFDKQLQSDGDPLEIVAAYDEGEQWVAGLETSSHTYFCEGFGAHNCVAEHSILLTRYFRQKGASLTTQLWALLHDASEAYLVDVPRPVKPFLSGYKDAEVRVMRAICDRFDLPRGMPGEVHAADGAIIADERFNMAPCATEWAATGSGLGVYLRNWTPDVAEAEFLDEFHRIQRARQEVRRAA